MDRPGPRSLSSPTLARRKMGGLVLGGLAAPAILCAQPSPPARSLTIAAAAETTSLDPHFQDHDPTITVQRHVYEFLVGQGPRMELVPELAESWRARDPLTWEFRLRRGVVWHDGAPFTAADVIASLKRVPTVENSPSSFVPYVRQITAMEAEDSHTLVLRTATPFPLMPNYMGAVMIIPARLQAAKTTDFNTLAAAVGTGPYRVVDYVRGQRVVLEANPRHWAGPPANPRVVFRFITATGSRVAALMAGDVDLIEQPPPVDIPALRANPRTRVWESVGNRVVYFGLDFHRDRAAGVAAPDGSAIANPFRDLRVRQALSLAINRETICSRVIEGLAAPANQMVAAGVFGHDPAIPPAAYDPDRAKQLLAQAGLPDGFRMTIHGTSDRLVNDEKVLQALAQMYARIGVRAEVDAMLSTAFFPRVGRLEFSFFFNSWGAGSSGGVTTIRTALATYDDEKGMGRGNRGRYSNPEVDRRIAAALETIDDAERERLTREATAIAMADVAVIPTHWTKNLWASRAGLAYEPRMDGFTLATGVRTTG